KGYRAPGSFCAGASRIRPQGKRCLALTERATISGSICAGAQMVSAELGMRARVPFAPATVQATDNGPLATDSPSLVCFAPVIVRVFSADKLLRRTNFPCLGPFRAGAFSSLSIQQLST